ncbi:MAG: hypothetical protein ACTHKY_15135 [Ginsengibacter sp.]
MQDLITSYIIQSKECKLAGLGKFTRTTVHAEQDIVNKRIFPPSTEILFTTREEKISDELIKYIADKKKIDPSEALTLIKKWCTDTKAKLKNGEEILLKPLGVLKKGALGNILFHTENNPLFFAPVPAERVIHKNSEHAVLVGDKETTSSVMNQFYHAEEPNKKSNAWKIFAIILLLIALVLLFFYFYGYPVSLSSFGSHMKVVPQTPTPTYTIQ